MKTAIGKRITAAALILCMLAAILAGCACSKKARDDNTINISMWASAAPQIMGALREQFPDINFVVNEYAGCNNSLYLKELLKRDQAGDIFFYTTFYNSSDAPTYLVDLSGYPFLTNYDKAILSTLDVNGAIYQIPGPITVRYIIVNKTLFEERGWKIPENFDEVVAVCRQIHREAPEIAPLGLGVEGMGLVWTLVTSYAQMGYLDTAEGRFAEQGYRQGTASFGEAFGEGLDMVGQLVDAGAFMPEKFKHYWNVSPKHMGEREAAMCYVMSSSELYAKLCSGEAKGNPDFGKYNADEFIVLPMYGKNKANKGLILGTSNTWGISKKLEEKGNEKKLKNALRVLEYISSEEGQLAIRYNSSEIPAIKNLESDDIPEYMRNLWNDSTISIKSFFLYTGYEHMIVETGQILLDSMYAGSSEGMKEKFILTADKLNNEFIQNQSSSSAHAFAREDLSEEETRAICCEAFRTVADADAAIASESGIRNGASNLIGLSGQLFKGDVTDESLAVIVASRNVNVVSVPMTGSEIRQLLQNGKIVQNDDGENESFTCWAGGVDVIKKNGKITEIMLNGSPLDDAAVYKVAVLDKDLLQEFDDGRQITDTGVSIIDALRSYFKAQGTIEVKG